MNQVIAADRQRITIACHHPNVEVGASNSNTGGNGWRPAVDSVNAIRIHVIREPA